MLMRSIPVLFSFVSVALLCTSAFAQEGAHPIPDGLFAGEPQARIAGLAEVEEKKNKAAIGKVASMARNDTYAEVRAAACRVLQTSDRRIH